MAFIEMDFASGGGSTEQYRVEITHYDGTKAVFDTKTKPYKAVFYQLKANGNCVLYDAETFGENKYKDYRASGMSILDIVSAATNDKIAYDETNGMYVNNSTGGTYLYWGYAIFEN